MAEVGPIAASGNPAERVLYLFCFATDLALAAPGIGGVNDLVMRRWGSLLAVCGWTEVEQWSGPQGERNLQDLQWLGPRVMRHQAVIEAAMQSSPVLPARMGTLFSAPAALDRFLTVNQHAIAEFLSQTHNQREWAVKGLLDRAKAGDWLFSRLAAAQLEGSESSGARYLQQRRMRAAAAKDLNQWVAQTVESLTDQLRQHAAGFRQRGVGAPTEPGAPQTVVNLAFLVAGEALDEFRRCVERANLAHREHGLEFGLSGPWPPYSFCPALETPA